MPAQEICRQIGVHIAPLARRISLSNVAFKRFRVGRLEREILDLNALIAFRNWMIENLARNGALNSSLREHIRASTDAIKGVEVYDRQAVMQGFFEVYF